MTPVEKNNVFNSTDILYKAWIYRKILLAITSFAFVASIVVAFLITPLYKSTVIVFPAPSTTISKSFKNTTMYGQEEESERLLQVLTSDEIRLYMLKRYDLYKHYDIDTTRKDKGSLLIKKFERFVKIDRTEYMAIGINVLDKNPDTAAAMANDIARYSDTVMNIMEKKRTLKAFEIISEEYEARWAEATRLQDSLKTLMKLGVVDFESQARVFNDAYGKAVSKGNHSAAEAIKKMIVPLQTYGGTYISIRDYLKVVNKYLAILDVEYREARMDALQSLPHSFVINKAVVADKKAFPNRVLIILISTISALVLAFLSIVVIETINNFKKQEKEQAEA